MNFELMAERTRYLKQNPKRVSEMCKIFEVLRNEALEEGKEIGLTEGRIEKAVENAKNMLADGMLTLEKIAEYAGLPLDEVKKLKATL